MPTDPDDPLSNQNMKDRYYGVDDPVAEKLLQQMENTSKAAATATAKEKGIAFEKSSSGVQSTTKKDVVDTIPPPPGAEDSQNFYYPSQDPHRMGTTTNNS